MTTRPRQLYSQSLDEGDDLGRGMLQAIALQELLSGFSMDHVTFSGPRNHVM
jgi:hypothetical protein